MLYEVARHPGAEAAVLQEVDTFGRNRPLKYQDLAQFPYLYAALHESMPLWTTVSPFVALTRLCTQDCQLAGHPIPKGTRVMLNVWGMHRDPQIYPDPEAFTPKRFLPDNTEAKGRHPYAFLPFGAGPHKCIGYR
ncbi:hypothetical protein WJX72_006867 [[Myrmecia] bisecta]|uniref:Cytochrome P450 n=1 Tax=[Myrmecia] bisecta TaxID=41462 RepID=A0AAW1R7T9_9CHLO